LIETQELANSLKKPGIRVLNATWYMPNSGKDPKQEFFEERIPNSRFFDIDEVCDKSNELPHMLPSAE